MSAWASLFSSPTAAFTLQAQLAAQPLLHMPPNYAQQQIHGLGRGRPSMGRGGAWLSHMGLDQRGGHRGGMQRGMGMRGGRGGAHGGQKRTREDGTDEAAHKRTAHVRPPSPPPPPPVALTPEEAAEVSAWIAERKAKYPTRAALQAKEAEYQAAVARGEVRPRPMRGGRRERGEGRRERGGRGGAVSMSVHGGRPKTQISLPLLPQGERSDFEDDPSSDDEYDEQQSSLRRHPPMPPSTAVPAASVPPIPASAIPTDTERARSLLSTPQPTTILAQHAVPSTPTALFTHSTSSGIPSEPTSLAETFPTVLRPLSTEDCSRVLHAIHFLVQRMPIAADKKQ